MKLNGEEKSGNEVEEFFNCRYISCSESIWKIYNFSIHERSHAIQKLSCHLKLEQTIVIKEGEELQPLQAGPPETTLTAFFRKNQECPEARSVLYPDFPYHFTWQSGEKQWNKRIRDFG